MLNTFFRKSEPKRLVYRDCTLFSEVSFLTDLSNSIKNAQCYEDFETKTFEVLDNDAPQKTKLLKGNLKPISPKE